MGRIYTVSTGLQAVTAAQDLITLTLPNDLIVQVHWWKIGQSSDAGDAESEQLLAILHRTAAAGSGGSSITPKAMNTGDVASSVTAARNNTTQSTLTDQLDDGNFNVMAGISEIYTPETRPIVSPSKIIVLELAKAPADSINVSATLCFEEIGG